MSRRTHIIRVLGLLSLLIVAVVLAEEIILSVDGVDVHAKKVTMSALVVTLRLNDKVQVLSRDPDGWAHVKVAEKDGYVLTSRLEPPKGGGFGDVLKNMNFQPKSEASDRTASMAARGLQPGAAAYAYTKNYNPAALNSMIDTRRDVVGAKFDQFTEEGHVGKKLAWSGGPSEVYAQFKIPKVPNIPMPKIPVPGGGHQPVNTNPKDGLDILQKAWEVGQMDDPQRQEELGQSIALAISNRYPLCKDERTNQYITLVGLTVASASPRPDLEYAFGLLETNEIGAFSAPGGCVFITRGALRLMQDESELAGVLAHEIGHVVKNHGIEAVKSAKMKVVADKAVSQYGGKYSQFSSYADQGTEMILVTGYSQTQEREADAEAIRYLVAANYDPRGFVRFLGRMDQSTRAPGGMPKAMSTHPGTPERIANTSRQIGALPKISGETLKDRFDLVITKP